MKAQDLGSSGTEKPRRVDWRGLLTVALLVAFVIVLLGAAALYLFDQCSKRVRDEERRARNSELGLPTDFPIDVVPLYAGAEIITAEKDSAVATDGASMDKWSVHAELEGGKDDVYSFYHERMLAAGMRQTQFVSIPTGYGADYADRQFVIEFIIEYRPGSERLQLEITAYRVRD